jgi:hypothetical protein
VFFFVVIVLINVGVGLLRRRLALPRAELILIYCMLLMAVTVPTWGLMFFLIGTMVYPYYYATPENRFAELFHDLIPSWMAPQDMAEPVRPVSNPRSKPSISTVEHQWFPSRAKSRAAALDICRAYSARKIPMSPHPLNAPYW